MCKDVRGSGLPGEWVAITLPHKHQGRGRLFEYVNVSHVYFLASHLEKYCVFNTFGNITKISDLNVRKEDHNQSPHSLRS